MINIITKIAYILILVLSAKIAFAQTYTWQALSQDDAVQLVRVFESDPNLAVTITDAPIPGNQAPDALATYTIVANQSTYIVWARSSGLFFRSDNLFLSDKEGFYGQPYDANVLNSQTMSQNAAQAIALSFLQSHYPASQVLTKIEVSPHIADKASVVDPNFIDSYSFRFSQDCGNGVTGPSDCDITVDSVKGEIVSYNSTFFPILVSTLPVLTADQAMAAAMNGLQVLSGQPGSIESILVTGPDALGVEKLVYVLDFVGVGPLPDSTPSSDAFRPVPNGYFSYSPYSENYVAIVDADTGGVLGWNITLGEAKTANKLTKEHLARVNELRANMLKRHIDIGKPLKFTWSGKSDTLNYVPLLITSCPYMSARYLCYGSSGANLTVTMVKQFAINGTEQQVSFRLDSLTYQVNGQTKQMSAKPVLINGHCYVPLDVMNAVLPGKFTYDAKAQTVRYDPPQPKQASK